jgi:hypothetical protein
VRQKLVETLGASLGGSSVDMSAVPSYLDTKGLVPGTR